MGRTDPGELKRLEDQSQQIVKQTLDHLRQLFAKAEGAAANAAGPRTPVQRGHAGTGLIEEHHEHRMRGAEWPSWILERIVPKDGDSTGVKVGKIGLVIISPVLVGPAALFGVAIDKVQHFFDFFMGPYAPDDVLWPKPTIGDINAYAWDPNVQHAGEPEEPGMKVRGTVMDTVPPVPVEKPRERNKCGAAARGRR